MCALFVVPVGGAPPGSANRVRVARTDWGPTITSRITSG